VDRATPTGAEVSLPSPACAAALCNPSARASPSPPNVARSPAATHATATEDKSHFDHRSGRICQQHDCPLLLVTACDATCSAHASCVLSVTYAAWEWPRVMRHFIGKNDRSWVCSNISATTRSRDVTHDTTPRRRIAARRHSRVMHGLRDGVACDASAQLRPPAHRYTRHTRCPEHRATHGTASAADCATIGDPRPTCPVGIERERRADQRRIGADHRDVIGDYDDAHESRARFDTKTSVDEQHALPRRPAGEGERAADVNDGIVVSARAAEGDESGLALVCCHRPRALTAAHHRRLRM